MADLRRTFARLDEIPVPDLRHDVEHREPRPAVPGRSARARIAAGIVAFAVFAAGAVLVWSSFGPGAGNDRGGTAASRTYRDPAGWTVRVPPGWHALPFDVSKGAVRFQGVQLSNVSLPAPQIDRRVPIQARADALPPDGVALIIARTFAPPGQSEVPLPLSLDDLASGSAPGGTPTLGAAYFAAGGWTFVATVETGPTAETAATQAVGEAVASFRYPQPPTSACGSPELSAGLSGTEGAAGTLFFTVTLTNESTTVCHVEGSPTVELLDPSGAVLPVDARAGLPEGPSLQPSTVVLYPGDEAELVVAFSDVNVGDQPCFPVGAVRITPGLGGGVDVPLDPGAEICSRTVWAAPFAAPTGGS
jgi:hypothetical protein